MKLPGGGVRLLLIATVCALGVFAAPAGPVLAARSDGTPGVCEAPPEPGSPADALSRGNRLLARDDPAAARAAYRDAAAAARAAGNPGLALLADANAARAAVEAGARDDIPADLERIATAAQGTPEAVRLDIHLGRTASLLAFRHPDDTAAWTTAANLLGRAERQARDEKRPRMTSYALGFRGELYERRNRRDDALVLTRRALLAALEADAPDALYRWQWQLGRLDRAAGQTDAALEQYRQAAATLDGLRRQASAATAAWDTASAQSLYLELADLLLRKAAETAEPAPRQALLVEARDALEAQKAEELTDYFRDECLAAQRKARPDEIPGTVFVYPIALPDRLAILVGGSGPLELVTLPIGRERLTTEVDHFRARLTRRTTREYLRYAHTLYDWLITPIEPLIEARKPDTLVFVPDGPLRTIPFAALQDPKTGEFLIERHALAIVPSLTLTEPRPFQDVHVRVLTAGLSESVEGFPPLVYVPEEVAAIEGAFPGQELINQDFVIKRFEHAVETRPFGIVHIASHAEFGGDPDDSFLLAYDGRLPMNELANVVGTTRFRREQPLELLTLSACETAVGNDRAGLGLAGIAVRAGARSALASLWSVNDEAAASLFEEFYSQLSAGKQSRAGALQAAQLKLLAHRGFRHPAFWSAFVLISSWL